MLVHYETLEKVLTVDYFRLNYTIYHHNPHQSGFWLVIRQLLFDIHTVYSWDSWRSLYSLRHRRVQAK